MYSTQAFQTSLMIRSTQQHFLIKVQTTKIGEIKYLLYYTYYLYLAINFKNFLNILHKNSFTIEKKNTSDKIMIQKKSHRYYFI